MFSVEKGILEPYGYEQITMKGEGHEVRILPQAGFNLWYWTFEGKEILMKPVDITVFGSKYGIPILFPTPNRIPNGEYTWQGKKHVMTKRGERVVIHGTVKDEPFTVTRLEAEEDCAVCEAEIVFAPGNALFEGWPFPCTLRVVYTLDASGLHMNSTVINDGAEEMPFGYAVHPYFSKRGDANKVSITVPVSRLYEADENLFPSGRIVPADEAHTICDDYHTVESLYLDNVYRGMTSDLSAKIRYEDIVVTINSSDCFRNAVVYTPHDRPGFCIEPQTCSTNFINLHGQGFIDESGLLVLPAGQTFTCRIDYTVEKQF